MENQSTQQLGRVHGIYTLSQPDLEHILNVENDRTNLTLNFNVMPRQQLLDQLENLFTLMLLEMRKHLTIRNKDGTLDDTPFKEFRIETYSFYDLKEALPEADGIDELRRVCELAFTLWGLFLKQLNVVIPTGRS
jgi:hypothetical protein